MKMKTTGRCALSNALAGDREGGGEVGQKCIHYLLNRTTAGWVANDQRG